MEKIIVYPSVYLGLLTFPALFFAGLYLFERKLVKTTKLPSAAWLAAFGYSAATFAAWWTVYFVGGRLPLGSTNNALASLSQIFGYSAYALLPVTIATAAVSLAGVVVCVVKRHACH